MVIIQVYVRVKEKEIDQFTMATVENVKNSIHEPGVIRFDFMQEENDPQSFLLTEIYEDHDASSAHKTTSHYLVWRECVADMMDKPREGIKYNAIYPLEEKSWKSLND
jgi:(4S)-4-hydroxy-5-phosphonooxypentane-2,3-dione isomerase